MRCWWIGLLSLVACSQTTSLGSYRLPVPLSANSVELMTVLVKTSDVQLVLYDTEHDVVYATGHGQLSTASAIMPYDFTIPEGAPFRLVVSDGVLQDGTPRPYTSEAIASLSSGAKSLARITLSDGTGQRVIVSSGGNLFTEVAEPQPLLGMTPGPLFALNSVAGDGLVLPPGFDSVQQWHDAISTYIPPNPKNALPCAAGLVAAIHSASPASVTVPAGTFDAAHVTEVIDTCRQPSPPDLRVYQVDRWFAAGVGPVRMSYLDSNSGTHDYRLVSFHMTGSDKGFWPLEAGNSWTYEVVDPTGAEVGTPVTVTVANVAIVTQP